MQAKGVAMDRSTLTDDQAFRVLAGQPESNRKLHDIASRLSTSGRFRRLDVTADGPKGTQPGRS